jgi:hypothetical protein
MARLHYAGRDALARNCTQRLGGNAASGDLSHFCDNSYIGTKSDSHKVTVEKRGETPYGTRSYLPGGAASENRAARRQVVPPCSLCGRPRGKRCYFELVLRQMPKAQMDRLQFKRT